MDPGNNLVKFYMHVFLDLALGHLQGYFFQQYLMEITLMFINIKILGSMH